MNLHAFNHHELYYYDYQSSVIRSSAANKEHRYVRDTITLNQDHFEI